MNTRQLNITGNPYGVETLVELDAKLAKMRKKELIAFAQKVGQPADISETVQAIRSRLSAAFKKDGRRINPMDAPRPKQFNIDFGDEKVRMLFNL